MKVTLNTHSILDTGLTWCRLSGMSSFFHLFTVFLSKKQVWRESVLVLCTWLNTSGKMRWALAVFLLSIFYHRMLFSVPQIFIISALSALRAIICVHSKPVYEVECKLTVALTFASLFSVIHPRLEKVWPLFISSGIKQGLDTKLRLYIIDPQAVDWLIPICTHVHVSQG